MLIAETKIWHLGRFTIRQQPRFDNPYWSKYLVFCRSVLIGSMFSVPDLSACISLERERRDSQRKPEAAPEPAHRQPTSHGRRGRKYGRATASELKYRAYLPVIRDTDD